MIKCVVWDIDNTLLDGVYLESSQQQLPRPDPELAQVIGELAGRGIIHALASKNPPAAAKYVAGVMRLKFAAAECGWGRKSEAIRRIIADLGVPADAMAFVDDDLFERAEVAAALPELMVLAPEDAADAVSWPEFSPPVITAEARRRSAMYEQRRRRQEAAGVFAGSRDDFLRQAGTRVQITPAEMADLPRLHELSVRTHQFNSGTEPVSEAALAELLASPRHQVIAVRLADRFGDDGTVGGAAAETGDGSWSVPVLLMSCRALGRGVAEALLAWLCQAAARAGVAELRVPCLVTERNVPLRLALTGAGFRAETGPPAGRAVFTRQLSGALPALPDWAEAADQHG